MDLRRLTRRQLCRWLPTALIGLLSVTGCNKRKEADLAEGRIFDLSIDEKAETTGLTALPVDNIALLRDDRGMAAMQLICTHMSCQLRVKRKGLECPCHGSQFNLSGTPLNGPAKEPLKFYRLLRRNGRLAVNLSEEVSSTWRFTG